VSIQISTFKRVANTWLSAPEYDALRLRLESAHAAVGAAAVEARRRVRLNESREGRSGAPRRGRVRSPWEARRAAQRAAREEVVLG
jgi:hypothetical protein